MFKKYTKKYLILFLFAISIIGYYLSPFLLCYIDTNEKITLTSIGTGIIAIIGLYLFSKRLQKQQKQIDLQIEHRTDERFTDSIGLLGSSETSARTGAIYSLYQLALDDDKNKYRSQIAQILCSHIRSKTQELDYQTTHKKRPSNEIQTCINLLFKENGLYQQDFAAQHNFPRADLSYAYLIYANFDKAQCQLASFYKAQCQEVYFRKAQCQGADFYKAQCQGVNFSEAQCQGAYFYKTQCQGADFCKAQCQGADFCKAQCQGAYFYKAQCQGAIFRKAQCQGAYFYKAQCQGAIFRKAQCQGAYTDLIQTLSERIGKDTELNNIVFSGKVSIETMFQGAYTYPIQTLSNRIGKKTELDSIIFSGEISIEDIATIESAKSYLGDYRYLKLKKIITDNKGKKSTNKPLHEDIIKGVLEDSEEIQAIIAKDWDKLKQIQKQNK